MRHNVQLAACAALIALSACGAPATETRQPASPATQPPASTAPAATGAPSATHAPTTTPADGKGPEHAKVSDDMITNKLAGANTRFGFKLLAEILKKDGGQNIFISPASVAIALAMTYNGASGATQTAMAQALELQDMSLQQVNEAYAALKQALQSADPKVQLSIANSLWVKQGMPFNPEFIQRNELYFRAQVSELNFGDPNAAATINAWVSQNTNGKIDKIIDQISPEMVLFLINAIYFKGAWTTEFDKAKTQEQPFHLLNGSQIPAPMMSQHGKFPYLNGADFQAVGLPFGDGRVSMYVFLPGETSSLAAFQQSLSAANWDNWMAQFQRAEGDLKLPRFKLEYETGLNEALKALGMAAAFDPQQADFGAMRATADSLYISEVKHKTFVEVNEEGAEAAAVTSVGVGTTSIREEPPPFTMVVDRPFFFAIRDNTTGAVLFVGSIVQP